MRIALYLDDRGFSNLDLSDPSKGNNGVGGTQYCFLFLAYELSKNNYYQITIFHHNPNKLPANVSDTIIYDWDDMLYKTKNNKIDIFIFKADDKEVKFDLMNDLKINGVAWAHNFLLADKMKELNDCNAVKRVVFVGKEQYDRYIDHDLIKKSTYIFNMFEAKKFCFRSFPNIPTVSYTGSLVEGKGFDVLARVWKRIVKNVPNAQLYVIGNGQLYKRNSKLGSLGVADESFEKKFSKYLIENGALMQSVHFCGALGVEKKDVFMKTSVGVMNPSGVTETFGLSAVEMEACGIPVVTKAKNGLFDTVKNGYTGYLIRNDREIVDKITSLLIDETKNLKMGKNAKRFVEKSFSPDVIIPRWNLLFEDILLNKRAKYYPPKGNYLNNFKWLHIIVRDLRKFRFPIKPLAEIEFKIRKILKK